ncbi:MAG: SUMF1/EgtB/PvdO family nonheme iron enzyme [Polyangiaceae bacterium]|nr:SUMF1/EgtB/PvdO family nonheme iron enzyme [Polyangiaceae bacterium]
MSPKITVADITASLEDRLKWGAELAATGDPRVIKPERVLIPAGTCVVGGPGPENSPPARPLRRIYTNAFFINRYPVSVFEYSQFISASGYKKKRYWSDAGWTWCTENAATKPRFWGEPEWAAYLVSNHPVVGVNVYEAEAYAAFVGARLPTEAEWEKACRNGDDRLYPWGHTPVEDACQMRNYGPRGTVPIGTFPKGQSPWGLFDMVGCVWQWCRDVADDNASPGNNNPFVDPEDYDEGAARVTRGGAWNTLAWSVCAVSRNAYPPTAQFSNLGFRLAWDIDQE